MKAVLERLVEKHGTYGVDWMGFSITKKSPLTYHHIKKESEKGKKTVENGAPLSKKGHEVLNEIERVDQQLYDDWNQLFLDINQSEKPPTEEHTEKIKVLRMRGKKIEEAYFQRKRKRKERYDD